MSGYWRVGNGLGWTIWD